jgi:uncharacterized protein YuzE
MYEIARRTLTLCTDPAGEVVVTIGLPYEEPSGEWSCPYRIDGLAGWEHERKVTGVDSLQAVELALATMRAALTGSHEAKEGLLNWDEEPTGSRPQIVYVNWDKGQDIAYIGMKHEIMPGDAVRQIVADQVVLDYAVSGELLGVELTNAHTLLPSEMRI